VEKLKHPANTAAGAVDLEAAAKHVEAFLTALGHAPSSDPELASTGKLVARAWSEELLRGYTMRPEAILADTLAADGGELIVVRDLETTCICPHHLLPASGVVHVGYVPNGKIVGFGALARLVECFARRLTLQETLCERVADALVQHLGARGAACVADLAPSCLTVRGEKPAHARVTSCATAGVLRSDAALRAELFSLVGTTTAAHEARP
jgi:GTP cyclohydrolase I